MEAGNEKSVDRVFALALAACGQNEGGTIKHASRIYRKNSNLFFGELYMMKVKKDEIEVIYRAINRYYTRMGFKKPRIIRIGFILVNIHQK